MPSEKEKNFLFQLKVIETENNLEFFFNIHKMYLNWKPDSILKFIELSKKFKKQNSQKNDNTNEDIYEQKESNKQEFQNKLEKIIKSK